MTPKKLGVTGHQDLPETAIAFIREQLADICRAQRGALLGITSLAAGADQLFAEAVLEAGGRLRVVIPAAQYERSFAPADLAHYRRLLARAESSEVLDFDVPSEHAYLAAGRRVVDLADEMIAVWDGGPGRGTGGTADIVHYAESKRVPTTVVWPLGAKRA